MIVIIMILETMQLQFAAAAVHDAFAWHLSPSQIAIVIGHVRGRLVRLQRSLLDLTSSCTATLPFSSAS